MSSFWSRETPLAERQKEAATGFIRQFFRCVVKFSTLNEPVLIVS